MNAPLKNPSVLAELGALGLALMDKRTSWAARAFVLGLGLYLVSPFDLAMDFIPVLGWLDDAAIVTIGLFLARRLVSKDALLAARAKLGKEKRV